MKYISEDYCSEELSGMLMERGYIGALGKDDFNVEQITIQSAMKWLREVHGLFIRITEDMTGNVFEWSVYQKNYGCRASTYVEDSYEQACEEAIKYCLKILF